MFHVFLFSTLLKLHQFFIWIRFFFYHFTCKKGHKHGHPAQDVGPREAPGTEASPQEVDCHPSINGHTQQNKEGWEGVIRNLRSVMIHGWTNVIFPKEERLTGDKKHNSCSIGAIKPFKGGEVGEGHDSGDDACEARHRRKDHKGPGGIPVGWEEWEHKKATAWSAWYIDG